MSLHTKIEAVVGEGKNYVSRGRGNFPHMATDELCVVRLRKIVKGKNKL
jgi:hypothetical protein